MNLVTLPVYSKLAEERDLPPGLKAKLPVGWRLSAHQLTTYQTMNVSDVDVVFNVAMTGDGKSLAGQLSTLVEDRPRPFIVMYPTNELIRDQLGQVEHSMRLWQRNDLRAVRLDARRLDELEDKTELERRDVLLSLWRNYEVVLTNPDIFHYVMQQYYIRTGKTGDAPDRVIGPLLQSFDQFTFDEFHVFQTPQVVAVVNALLFIHEVTGNVRPKKFLFLSATPEELLVKYLKRAGLRCVQISGNYAHSCTNPDPTAWRQILHRTAIHFAPQSAEQWISDHVEDTLLRFFLEHRSGVKGAVIVNSVATAQRIVARLRPVLAAQGLTVESNTGFDAAERRRTSFDADLIVGTSTIDIGIDFQINFLVFESRDAGTFLQRLGRLGRHDGFSKSGTFYKFETFEAHALVPQWLFERLFRPETGTELRLSSGMEIDRERLGEIIRESFPPPATFAQYGRVWGGLQAAQVIKGLYHPTIKAQYRGTRENLAARYRKALQISVKRELARLIDLQKTNPALLDEARSFRGSGDLQCGIIDENETGSARVKKYDLFGLLSNFRLSSLEKDEFVLEVKKWQLPQRPYNEKDFVGFFRVFGVRTDRINLRVIVNRDLDNWGPEGFGVARVLDHVEVDAPEVPDLTRLNRALRQRKLVVLLCLLDPPMLARRLRLPWPSPLHRFCSRDGYEGSSALGRQALLLEVALKNRPDIQSGGERKPLIV